MSGKLKIYFKIFCWTLIGSIAFYVVFAFVFSLMSTLPPETSCIKSKEIYVSTNGIHLDIILPKKYLPSSFVKELNLNNEVTFIAFGWGDELFYLQTPTWGDLKFSTAIKALLLKSSTAIHITKFPTSSRRWHNIEVCEYQVNAILDYINKSFSRNEFGQLIEIEDSGYSNTDTFYKAEGNFNIIQTCNHWVNKGLKAANIKTAIWSPFDKGVLYHLNKAKSQ